MAARNNLYTEQARGRGVMPWLIRLPMLALTGFLLFGLIMVMVVVVRQFQLDGYIYPGVSAYGVALGGMTKAQALEAVGKRYTYGSQAVFTFRDGARNWQLGAADLGVQFEPLQIVEQAYQVGRAGGMLRGLSEQWQAWTAGKIIQPTIVYDQSKAGAFLQGLAAQLDRPVQDATILIAGAQVKTTAGQIGRTLDIDATLGYLRKVILNMSTGGEIPLVIRETKPEIAESESAGARVRAAIASAIQLYTDGDKAGPWQVTPDFIAGLIGIQRVEDSDGTAHYEVTANTAPLKTILNGLASSLGVEPVGARFVFNPNTKQIESIKDSVNGRSLNIEVTLKRIEDTIFKPDNRRVALVFTENIPKVNSRATAQDLGIVEEIVSATTYFYGSSAERRVNIQVAASKFHGLVIAPGEVFSFNDYLGDVSPETGYETGLVIVGNQTIKGVGGGVCQVSSTVFQAAFYGGFPINERYAHGYRVGYYESGIATVQGVVYKSTVGMDATVYGPIVDFKFTNDTPNYMLMETFFEPSQQSLTVKLFSTATGRVITKDGPTLNNYITHGPAIYEDTRDLAAGQSRQVDYAVDGVDVRVFRTIKLNGQTIKSREEFFSHYLPWQARFQVGKGGA